MSSHDVSAIYHDVGTVDVCLHSLEDVRALLQYVHIVVVIFILLLIFVAEHHLLLILVDRGLEDLVGALGNSNPLITFILEVVKPDFRISVRDTDVVAFVLQHS